MNLFGRYICILSVLFFLYSCNNENKDKQSKDDILSGEITVLVDESVLPIMQEQIEVFESSYYNAKVKAVAKPEVHAINGLIKGEGDIIILTRDLTEQEGKTFKDRSITPRIYPIAYDAVVLVANADADSTITSDQVVELMRGESRSSTKLLIDNPNSSVVRYMKQVGNLDKIANTNIETKQGAEEMLKSIALEKNKLGLMSFNQYLSLQRVFSEMDKIRILSVLNDTLQSPKYVKPTQASLSTGEYPLRREVKVLNYQPNMGLGLGFSAFLTGDRGQRIMLKSGLLPAKMPGREIIIRESVNK